MVHICRENPINVKLAFQLASFSNAPYWAVWKVFIELCKRYGRNTDDLQGTIESLVEYFQNLIRSLRVERRENRIDSVLGEPQYYDDKLEEFIAALKENLLELLTDKTTMTIYNNFCSSAIFITDCVSIVDGFTDLLDDTIELIKDHTE